MPRGNGLCLTFFPEGITEAVCAEEGQLQEHGSGGQTIPQKKPQTE